MAGLTRCIENLANLRDDDAQEIWDLQKQIVKEEGASAQVASIDAAEIFLKRLENERKNVIKQIRAQGYYGPLDEPKRELPAPAIEAEKVEAEPEVEAPPEAVEADQDVEYLYEFDNKEDRIKLFVSQIKDGFRVGILDTDADADALLPYKSSKIFSEEIPALNYAIELAETNFISLEKLRVGIPKEKRDEIKAYAEALKTLEMMRRDYPTGWGNAKLERRMAGPTPWYEIVNVETKPDIEDQPDQPLPEDELRPKIGKDKPKSEIDKAIEAYEARRGEGSGEIKALSDLMNFFKYFRHIEDVPVREFQAYYDIYRQNRENVRRLLNKWTKAKLLEPEWEYREWKPRRPDRFKLKKAELINDAIYSIERMWQLERPPADVLGEMGVTGNTFETTQKMVRRTTQEDFDLWRGQKVEREEDLQEIEGQRRRHLVDQDTATRLKWAGVPEDKIGTYDAAARKAVLDAMNDVAKKIEVINDTTDMQGQDYFISTGESGKVFTLRRMQQHWDAAMVDLNYSSTHVTNLGTSDTKAVTLAKQYMAGQLMQQRDRAGLRLNIAEMPSAQDLDAFTSTSRISEAAPRIEDVSGEPAPAPEVSPETEGDAPTVTPKDTGGNILVPTDEVMATLTANGVQVKIETAGKKNRPIWVVSGKTFPIKNQLKEMFIHADGKNGVSWNNNRKAWIIWSRTHEQDVYGEVARILDANSESAGSVGDGEEDLRILELRQRADSRDDGRRSDNDYSELVSSGTRALLRGGEDVGIPKEVIDNQIVDVGMIANAYDEGRPLFLLANGAGTGKTFVLGGAIRELKERGAKHIRYYTMNTALIDQLRTQDLSAYGVDDVVFDTYSQLSTKRPPPLPDDSVLIFDEAHNIKATDSKRAKPAMRLIEAAKFTIFASATPFENPVQTKYMEPTGLFDEIGGFTTFAKMFGAQVRKLKDPRGNVIEIPVWSRGKVEDGVAAREWILKQGIMTQREIELEQEKVVSSFKKRDISQEYVDKYNNTMAAYEAALGKWRDENGTILDSKIFAQISMHQKNTEKRILEAAKVDFAIERIKELRAEGKSVVLFTDTKADRIIGRFRQTGVSTGKPHTYAEMSALMNEYRTFEAMRQPGDPKVRRPFSEAIFQIATEMHNRGIDFELPQVGQKIKKAFPQGEVGFYNGSVSEKVAKENKAKFLSGELPVLVATMAKGGTGLSLHDTKGNRPTAQVNINLPWVASQVAQVSGRIARYGLASKAEIDWLFAGNIPFEQELAKRVGGRMLDMGALVSGVKVTAGDRLDNWDFEDNTRIVQREKGKSVEQAQKEAVPFADQDIWERAEVFQFKEKGRREADTRGGFFQTPYKLAALMTQVAEIQDGHRVLEPSAGHGRLLELLPQSGIHVTAIEQNYERWNTMMESSFPTAWRLERDDFMEQIRGEDSYDRIIMNPPFEKSQDIDHVLHAYTQFLAPGGRIVAVMNNSAFTNQTKKAKQFREFLASKGAQVATLPKDTFKSSGTGINTRLVVIDQAGEGTGTTTWEIDEIERGADFNFQPPPLTPDGDTRAAAGPNDAPASTIEQIEEAIRGFSKRAGNQLLRSRLVTVVQSQADLPQEILNDLDFLSGSSNVIFGVHSPKMRNGRGQVFIVADYVKPHEVNGLLLHELGVHHGLRDMLGKKLYREVLKTVHRKLKEPGQNVWKIARATLPKDTPPGHVLEEVIAYVAEHMPEQSLMQRIFAAIRNFLRRYGFVKDLTPDDVAGMARAAAKRAAAKDRAVATTQEDFAKFHRAWHGTPHDFEQFSTQYLGTGEGNQAFGWGLYFADNRAVAEHYRDTLTVGPDAAENVVDGIVAHVLSEMKVAETLEMPPPDASEITASLSEMIASMGGGRTAATQQRIIEILQPDGKLKRKIFDMIQEFGTIDGKVRRLDQVAGDAFEKLSNDIVKLINVTVDTPEGRLYQVELAPIESQYLHWDRKYSDQFAWIRNRIPPNIGRMRTRELTGEEIYKRLSAEKGGDRQASEHLKELGIPGIKYLDADTRFFDADSTALQTHNYVIFDDADIDIEAKYQRQADREARDNLRDALHQATRRRRPLRKILSDAMGDKVSDLRQVWMGALTREQVVDIAKEDLPLAARHLKRAQKMEADKVESLSEPTEIAQAWQRLMRIDIENKLKGRNTRYAEKLADLMHDATLKQIDPSSTDDSGMAGYDDLRRRYNDLSPAAQALFLDVRNMYRQRNREFKEALIERIGRSLLANRTKAAMQDHVRLMFERAQMKVYFPLARFGDYWVRVSPPGEPEEFMMFERAAEQTATIEMMQQQGIDAAHIRSGKSIKQARENHALNNNMVMEMMDMIDESPLNNDEANVMKDQVYQIYLQSLPEMSIRRAFIHRKGTPGFSKDALRAFSHNMFHGAHQLARIRHADVLALQLEAMGEQAQELPELKQRNRAADYVTELHKRFEWAMNPESARWSSALTGFGFMWYLGASPAAAIVNLTQVPIVTFPVLGAKYGYSAAGSEIMKAFRDYTSGLGSPGRRQALLRERGGDMGRMIKELEEGGAIDRTLYHSLAGASEHELTKGLANHYFTKIFGFMFHQAEMANREVTAIATYRLARNRGISHEAATIAAWDAVYETQFDYSNSNRARFMQNDFTKVALLFRQYSQNMSYLLWRNLYKSLKSANAEQKKEAAKKLTGILGMTSLFAGAAGLPLAGLIRGMAEMFSDAFGDDDEPTDMRLEMRHFIQDITNPTWGRIISKGLANEAGIDLQSRTSLAELWFRSPDRELEGRDWWLNFMEQIAGPVAAIGGNAFRGYDLMQEGKPWRGLESMTPKVFKDIRKAWRYGTEGVETLRGDKLIANPNMGQIFAQAMGFSPAELAERYDENNAIKRLEAKYLKRRRNLIDGFAAARFNNDRELMDKALDNIRKWNATNPQAGISSKTIGASLRGKQRRSAETEKGVYLRLPALREQFDEMRFINPQ